MRNKNKGIYKKLVVGIVYICDSLLLINKLVFGVYVRNFSWIFFELVFFIKSEYLLK